MAETDEDLKNKIIGFLENNRGIKYSISQLCEEIGLLDDHAMASIMGELEIKGNAIQNGERIVCSAVDGKATLALYFIPLQV